MTMLYDDPIWIEDIDTVSRVVPELDELAGKSVLITGAAGLICSAVVDVLFRYNDMHEKKIRIFAAGRSREKIQKRFGVMADSDDFSFVFFDAVSDKNHVEVHADYIIHGAGNSYPSLIVKEPVETMLGNFLGLKYLLDLAKTQGTKRVLYISSSEVYGQKANDQPCKEDEYGYIDLLDPRSSYSVGKRAAETLCAAYASEYGVDFVIVRPGHIYGPTASPDDNRVSSSWAYCAAGGENIVMKSDGAQLRSYLYCPDCASAMLKVLLCGENSHAYNISKPDSIISIRELADKLAASGGVRVIREDADARERKSFNPMRNSSLDSTGLESLGWKGIFDADRGLDHTVSILKDVYFQTKWGKGEK